ncbi:40S ribosomal protein S6 [Spraguea lophii 42_110]|uniref:40S ribosomal protein S6 n=1 Tax=Spraguea lophii (strain 42_110) TaxID=1358809 RepID=UPI0022656FAF|nr:40S ribosomal protein S6 [Spraguea lophii 42_110]7QCA_SG0 Chain SG0, 40S ribosomal protein S6 [Spraguea lophii 42_110]
MKLNISYPTNGTHKTFKLDFKAEQRLYGKKTLDTFDGSIIKPEWEGLQFQITGGSDVQGFPMIKTLLTDKRKKLLLKKGDKGFKPVNRKGLRKRKTVRGSIIASDISMVCVSLIDAKEVAIEGLTDVVVGATHWPKRFNKLKAKAGFSEDADVTAEQVLKVIKDAILEVNGGDIKKLPKLKVSRYQTEKQKERKAEKIKLIEERKKKSEKERADFLKKYPDWQKKFATKA